MSNIFSSSATLPAHLAVLSSISFGGFPHGSPGRSPLCDRTEVADRSGFRRYFPRLASSAGPQYDPDDELHRAQGRQEALPALLPAALATFSPPCCMYYASYTLWDRFRDRQWQNIVRQALAPLTIGLVIAAGYVMARAADAAWPSLAITAAAVVLMLRALTNPLWILIAGGAAGGLGLL